MADREQCKRVRTAACGWVTSTVNDFNETIKSGDCDRADIEAGLRELNKRLDSLEGVEHSYEMQMERKGHRGSCHGSFQVCI